MGKEEYLNHLRERKKTLEESILNQTNQLANVDVQYYNKYKNTLTRTKGKLLELERIIEELEKGI